MLVLQIGATYFTRAQALRYVISPVNWLSNVLIASVLVKFAAVIGVIAAVAGAAAVATAGAIANVMVACSCWRADRAYVGIKTNRSLNLATSRLRRARQQLV